MIYKHVNIDIKKDISDYLTKYISNIPQNEVDGRYTGYVKGSRGELMYVPRPGSEFHKKRFQTNIEWLIEIITENKSKKILILGDMCVVELYLQDRGYLNTDNITCTDTDLRESFPFYDNSFDVIINTEVFEHIKDKKDSPPEYVSFSGLNHFLKECYRVLKPQGIMLLSTPNIISTKSICRMLLGGHPHRWPQHFREYSPEEVKWHCEQNKFRVELLETIDVGKDNWDGDVSHPEALDWKKYEKQMNLMMNYISILIKTVVKKDRGDLIMCICRK